MDDIQFVPQAAVMHRVVTGGATQYKSALERWVENNWTSFFPPIVEEEPSFE